MPRGSKPKIYDAALVERVAELYSSGMTQSEVGAEVGLTQRVIWRLMVRHSLPTRTAAKRDQRGSKNHMWKGNDASYAAFHYRQKNMFGKARHCEICGKDDDGGHYDWANLTGQYSDPSDYKQMCRSCHWKYDLKIFNIKHMRRDADGQVESA